MTANALRASALTLAAATLLAALPLSSAEAQWYPRRNHTGEAIAGGVVGGVIGGLAAGAIINSGQPRVYYPPVAEPAPVYVEPEPHYVPSCYIVRRKVWLDSYAYTFRRERVCD
jgi:hypothetical protein